MDVFFAKPPPDLAPYIDRFWGWRAAAHEPLSLPRLLPGTGAELHIHYGTAFRTEASVALPDAYLLCLRQINLPLAAARGVGFVAVRFRIGQVHRLVPLPPALLLDRVLPVDACWGQAGQIVARRVQDAADWPQQCTLLIDFFRRCLCAGEEDRLIVHGMAALYRVGGQQTIDNLAAHLGIGRRQLEKRWLRYCGQTPSETRGAIRFQQTLKRMLLNPGRDPLSLALDHGYYDQSHWIRDFRQRVGMPPASYLSATRSRTHFYNLPAS